MNDVIKNKAEIFKQICIYELNQVQITSETISMNDGSQRCFEFVLKNENDEIICLGEMPPEKHIENYIKSIEDKIEKGLLNCNVFIYSIQYDKIMYVSPYREWPTYDFERMGMTPKAFIKSLKKSYEELKQEDDLKLDKLKQEFENLKNYNSENEKKYQKLKEVSESYQSMYRGIIEKLEKQNLSIKKNEIDRLKYEFKKNISKIDIFNPLKKLGLTEKREYCFNFQKDEIILKINLFWYFEGGKDEVAGYHDNGCKYYLLDLDKKEYIEVNDDRYLNIINWLQYDMDFELIEN
jgi:hypothetical protein